VLAQIAVWDWYKAKHRRLLASVRAFLPGEDVEDVALVQRWTSSWPGFVGLGVVAAAACAAARSLKRSAGPAHRLADKALSARVGGHASSSEPPDRFVAPRLTPRRF
jgi:hypothetical protein